MTDHQIIAALTSERNSYRALAQRWKDAAQGWDWVAEIVQLRETLDKVRALADQWQDTVDTCENVMTTPQANAYRSCIRELCHTLDAANVPEPPIGAPDLDAAATRSENMNAYLSEHPDASIEDIVAYRTGIDDQDKENT